MLIIAFNGSPRNNGTTAILLNKALEGAASQGAKTEFVQLNQLAMKGCQSCYACKKRGGESYGKCALNDGMTPLYARIEHADAIFVGSPIYFHAVTSETRMFIERLFPYITFRDFSSLFPRKIPVGLVFTMGVDEQGMETYREHIEMTERTFLSLLGPTETLISYDTFHVKDYYKIVADALDKQVERKSGHQQTVFPLDCRKAFDMGARFAGLT